MQLVGGAAFLVELMSYWSVPSARGEMWRCFASVGFADGPLPRAAVASLVQSGKGRGEIGVSIRSHPGTEGDVRAWATPA
eukprot:1507564-Lingulodinium_polyedra.AAC.1